eukprot:2292695-Amphidinium_carterae.1
MRVLTQQLTSLSNHQHGRVSRIMRIGASSRHIPGSSSGSIAPQLHQAPTQRSIHPQRKGERSLNTKLVRIGATAWRDEKDSQSLCACARSLRKTVVRDMCSCCLYPYVLPLVLSNPRRP